MIIKKQKFQLIYLLFSLIAFGSLFISSSGGRDDNYSGAPGGEGTCFGCHFGGASGGSIALSNIPVNFMPGQTYALTLSMQNSAAVVGGFQIVATNGSNSTMVGTFTPPSMSGTRLTTSGSNRLTHNSSKAFSGNSTSWTFNWTAPTSNIPPNVVFYYAGNAANGNGGSGDGDAILTGTSNTVLPIELLHFSAERSSDKTVNLSWKTASERNNRHFNLERSSNNQKFETIGQVKGNGTSAVAHTYQFTDDLTNAPNNIVYYRLQQVDFDGAANYSKTVSVALESKPTLKIYPSFAKKGDILTLETVSNATIDVLDINGKVVQTVQQSGNKFSANTEKATLNIRTSELSSGRYFVRFVSNGIINASSFIVF